MQCQKCEAKFPPHYKECQSCKSKVIEKEVYAPQSEEVEKVEPISALVVQSEFEVDE